MTCVIRSTTLFVLAGSVCLFWCCAAAWPVPPDMTDNALRTMCQRGLAESAVEYCRAQFNLQVEDAPARARWAMRHMECQSQAALRSTGADPSAKWQLVEKIESDYRRLFPEDPRLPWLSWQAARSQLLRGQQSLARWLATPAADPQREQTLQSVRKVQTMVEALDKDIKERLPLSQNRAAPNRQATSRELHELQLDCALLRCEAFLIRAKCYPSDSPDHLTALAEVDSTADSVFRQAAPDWSSRDELLVAQATAGLEVGKRRQSLDVLIKTLLGQAIEGEKDPNIVNVPVSAPSELARLRAGGALVEALCADDKPEQAAEFLKELNKNFTGPEVDMAALRIDIARMKQLPASQRPSALASIVANTKAIGERYGAYWRNRSEALLIAEASSSTETKPPVVASKDPPSRSSTADPVASTGGMPELLAIEVRQLLAGGQTVAAIAKLRSAITAAESAKRWDEALQLALEAARLMQKEKQWLEATDLLAPLASAHRDAKDAAAAHALAAWCVAQSLKDSAPQAIEKRYEELLNVQLTEWPNSPETIKATEYLSAWLTNKKRYEDLTSLWLDRAASVSDQDRRRMALDQWLITLIGRVPKAKVTAQIDKLAGLVAAGKLSSCQRPANMALIAAAMFTSPVTLAEAESLTGCKLPGNELQQPAGEQALLAALMMLDAIYRTDAGDARTVIEPLEVAQLNSTVNLAWCRAVALAADELPEGQMSQWSPVFQRVKLPSDAGAITSPVLKMTQLRLEQLSAKSAEDNLAALAKIKQLAQDNSTDPQLQLNLAAAVAQSSSAPQGRAERLAEATKLLKRVAVGTKKDSEAHLRARWLEARWSLGRGDQNAAAQIASLTLSSGDIQPAWWKARFENLNKSP